MSFNSSLVLLLLALCVIELTAKSHRHRYGESPENEKDEEEASHQEKSMRKHHRSHRRYGDDEVSDETEKSDSSTSHHHRRHHSKFKTHVGPDTDSSRTTSSEVPDASNSEKSEGHHHHRASRLGEHTALNKETVLPTESKQKFSKGWAPTEIFWSSDDVSNGYSGNVRSPYASDGGSDYPAKV